MYASIRNIWYNMARHHGNILANISVKKIIVICIHLYRVKNLNKRFLNCFNSILFFCCILHIWSIFNDMMKVKTTPDLQKQNFIHSYFINLRESIYVQVFDWLKKLKFWSTKTFLADWKALSLKLFFFGMLCCW